MANTNEACHILVKHLEAAAVLLWLAGIAEATGAVENAGERLEVDCDLSARIPLRLRENQGGEEAYNHR